MSYEVTKPDGRPPRISARALLITLVLTVSTPVVPDTVVAQDTVRVEAVNLARWGDTLEAEEELRIGALTGNEHEVFGTVSDLAVTADGTIWVVDGQVPVIRRFDARGRYLGSVGRHGGGPGEYRRPVGLELLPDGGLALLDSGRGRIIVYDSAGTFRRSHRFPAAGLSSHPEFHVDTAGHYYVSTPLRSASGGSDRGLIQVSLAGAVLDTVLLPERENNRTIGFPRQTLFAWSPHGELVVGANDDYSFTIRRANDTDVTVIREVDPVSVKAKEREWWTHIAERRERRAAKLGGQLEIPPIPETKPAFEDLRVDETGRIWVRRHVAAEGFKRPEEGDVTGEERTVWLERPTFDVYGPDGIFLGTVRLPYQTVWMASRGQTVWGLQIGNYDEIYVVRYGLSRSK